MTVSFPEGVKSLGSTSIIVATTLADPENPTLAELTTGTGVVNASCFFYNVPRGTTSAAVSEKPRRACERKARQGFGIETTELEALSYTYHPQKPLTDPMNIVRATCTPYTQKYIAMRDGLPAETEALESGDIVDIFLVDLGPQNKVPTGEDDQAEFSINQAVTVQKVWQDVEIL
ncbi:hypothetical protein [Nocardioides ochotonae]|uniref:phage tail tube protein n=1 Tax=Nocardioides ochotonae TaxID=2685869 RepID=UPI001408365A|nr:hypothetical protein [Nocardioides ochotonae]